MSNPIDTSTPQNVTCKVCGSEALLFGIVDLNKNCELARGRDVLPDSGIEVPYFRCPSCGLVFTIAFDRFTHDDFAAWIYNEQYVLVDPDYPEVRPSTNAKNVTHLFAQHKSLRILDYGAGSGKLAELLRGAGFSNVASYDPFVTSSALRPQGPFDVIVCFEVVEHSPTPRQSFADLFSLLAPDGLLMLSTLLQDEQFARDGIDWWYIAPRNGHVTIFSAEALSRLATLFGSQLRSIGSVYHFMYRQRPWFMKMP
jgi:SAM-dependent methyltransferase